MKLLKSVTSMQDAHQLVGFFKSKGILAFISNQGINSLYPEQGTFKAGIWIVADNQFDDAVQLLSDPDHPVQHPMTFEQMAALQKQLTVTYAAAVKMGVRVGMAVILAVGILALIIHLTTRLF